MSNQSKFAKFTSLTKDFGSVLAIEGRDTLSDGILKVAHGVAIVSEKVAPSDEQLKWAFSKRNEWEQKAKVEKARKDREAVQVHPGTATA
jgi:hypothetical protein